MTTSPTAPSVNREAPELGRATGDDFGLCAAEHFERMTRVVAGIFDERGEGHTVGHSLHLAILRQQILRVPASARGCEREVANARHDEATAIEKARFNEIIGAEKRFLLKGRRGLAIGREELEPRRHVRCGICFCHARSERITRATLADGPAAPSSMTYWARSTRTSDPTVNRGFSGRLPAFASCCRKLLDAA